MARLLIAMLFGMVLSFFAKYGGVIEGKLFPVMGPLTLTAPVQNHHSENLTVFQAEALKRRGCEFREIQWFLGPRNGRRVEVIAHFLDKPQVRLEDELLQWDGLAIEIPAQTVRSNSHADVLHQCPWRPWLTRTPFYDSEAAG